MSILPYTLHVTTVQYTNAKIMYLNPLKRRSCREQCIRMLVTRHGVLMMNNSMTAFILRDPAENNVFACSSHVTASS